jgi:hypothetical protein
MKAYLDTTPDIERPFGSLNRDQHAEHCHPVHVVGDARGTIFSCFRSIVEGCHTFLAARRPRVSILIAFASIIRR